MSEEQERAVQRSASHNSVARRCRQRLFAIPQSYLAFENAIAQWQARCVVTDSIRDERGLPMNRHESLVHGNPTLIAVWNRIHGRDGNVLISARHISNGHRTQEIYFDIVRRVIPQIEEPDDFDIEPILPDRHVPEGSQPIPELPEPPDPRDLRPSLDLSKALRSGLIYLLKGYRRSIAQQNDSLVYQSRLKGFLDSIAIAAASLDMNNLQIRGSSLIDITGPLPSDIRRNHSHPTYLRGYRRGRTDAYNSLRNKEQLARVEGPIRYRSTEYLLLLKSTYQGRSQIYDALNAMLD